jgi:hypothetical protein
LNDLKPKVVDRLNHRQPNSIVIEYKEESTIWRGVILFIFGIVVLIWGNAFTNWMAAVVFVITSVVSIIWIRRGFYDTALILTNDGFKFQNNKTVDWKKVNYVYFKNVFADMVEGYELIIQTDSKNYKIDVEDLDIDIEELGHWIAYFRLRRLQ